MSLTDNFDKLNKDKLGNKNDPPKSEAGKEIERYDSPGNVRNLCLVQPDGKRLFLNYAYLISGEFLPDDNSITLTYTTHVIKLKGHNLQPLHESLMAHVPKQITCVEKRYEATKEETETVVSEIVIKENIS
jgi:hypothetical protein